MANFPKNKVYFKRDLCKWPQIDTSSPYIENGLIYRDINRHQALYKAVQSGLTDRLAQKGFLPQHKSEGSRIVVEKIPWCVLPTEHCQRQRRDGLLNMLNLAVELNSHKFSIRDLGWQQVALRFSDIPLLIDFGSITYLNMAWQKVIIQRSHDWGKVIGLNIKSNSIPEMIKEVEGFIPQEEKTQWDNYGSDEIPQSCTEIEWISKWVKESESKTILDAGCNKGRIAKYLVTNLGVDALCCDTSGKCIADLYLYAQKHHLNITALKWDIMVPPAWCGYQFINADCFIGSSLTHHLYKAGHNFIRQEEMIRNIGCNIALVEYIDAATDVHVRPWGIKWTRKEFESAFNEWELLDTISPEFKSRIWYAYKRKKQ